MFVRFERPRLGDSWDLWRVRSKYPKISGCYLARGVWPGLSRVLRDVTAISIQTRGNCLEWQIKFRRTLKAFRKRKENAGITEKLFGSTGTYHGNNRSERGTCLVYTRTNVVKSVSRDPPCFYSFDSREETTPDCELSLRLCSRLAELWRDAI